MENRTDVIHSVALNSRHCSSENHLNQITVLFDGYSDLENADLMIANCTCTLIRGKATLTIVDTRTAWDADEIISGGSLLCTHRHMTRQFNNLGFPLFRARQI